MPATADAPRGSRGAANRLAAECGGIRTPALDLAAHPLPLTVREREIANLVAAGLSNRDIADRLTVSVRTVEGHLYRACIKLDISDREDLAALIPPAPRLVAEQTRKSPDTPSVGGLCVCWRYLLDVRIRRGDLEGPLGLDGRHTLHPAK